MATATRSVGGLGRGLREVLAIGDTAADEAGRDPAAALFGIDDRRVTEVLGALRAALVAAFADTVVISRYDSPDGPSTCVSGAPSKRRRDDDLLDVLWPRPGDRHRPSLEARLHVGCAATITARAVGDRAGFDIADRELFAAIVRLADLC